MYASYLGCAEILHGSISRTRELNRNALAKLLFWFFVCCCMQSIHEPKGLFLYLLDSLTDHQPELTVKMFIG